MITEVNDNRIPQTTIETQLIGVIRQRRKITRFARHYDKMLRRDAGDGSRRLAVTLAVLSTKMPRYQSRATTLVAVVN